MGNLQSCAQRAWRLVCNWPRRSILFVSPGGMGLCITNIEHTCGVETGNTTMNKYLMLSALLSLLFHLGCSSEEGLGRVDGIVNLDEKPLANASVEFTPIDGKGLTSYGRTDNNGAYYMMATRSDKGAAVGKNKVRITTYEVLDDHGKLTTVPERVPTRYNQSTELEADVKSGSNDFNFDLKTEGGRIANRRENP